MSPNFTTELKCTEEWEFNQFWE